jgi:hypothetical protein
MKKLLTYYLLFFINTGLSGQDITVEAEYPGTVQSGEQFAIQWRVNARGGDFTAPSFAGFIRLTGPHTSFSSSTQIINGRVSHETSESYLYYLQATDEGKFVLPPASVTIKNKTYYSDSVRIEVSGSKAPPAAGQQEADAGQHKTSPSSPPEGQIFLDLAVNRKEVFLGEAVSVTVKLYTRVDISGINEIRYPSFTGFLKNDLETPPLSSLRQENINGTVYGTGVLQQFLLYPQITGEITIDPVQITALVRQRSGRSDPFFGDFFSSYTTVPLAVASPPVKIRVKALPGTRPGNFSGISGKINITADINKDSVNVNDALSYKITISGTGNLRLAGMPVLRLPPDIEIYDPKVTENLKNSPAGTSGQKVFEYLLIPRHHGDYTIPSVEYSYFNVSTGEYEYLNTPEFRFHAMKGTDQASEIAVFGGVAKEDVRYLGKDIRFIRTKPGKLTIAGGQILSQNSFYLAYVISLLLFLIFLFLRREHIRRNADIAAVKNRRAGKVAVKRLKEASACMKKGDTDRFYEEILKAVWGYLSDKLSIPVSDLTRNSAIDSLRERGVDDEKLTDLADILDKCEYARYAPASSGTGVSAIYDDVSGFIRSVENEI